MNTALATAADGLKMHNLGQDSEFFLWDTEKAKVVPSYLHYPIKEEGFTNPEHTSFRAFRDGLAVEFNTPPSFCRATLIEDLAYIAKNTLPKALKTQSNILFTSRPYVEITKELIKQFPPDLQVLGCNPTLDAYTKQQKVIRVNPKKLLYRTSGAHLHMSFGLRETLEPTPAESIPQELWAPWIKACDLFLGVPFAYVFRDDLEFKRRKLYGQAGEFRYQQYPIGVGLEYRVLSSRLWNHPAIASLFLGFFKFVLGDFNFIFNLPWDKAWEDDIREAINTGDEKALQRAMLLWAQNIPGMDYTILPKSSVAEYFAFWDRVRRIAATLPDAGTAQQAFKEAHYGWNDYSQAEFAAL